MKERIVDMSQEKAARIAGLAYLVIIIAGIVAEFVLRSSLIESGDAAATAANITGSESLFRFSIALDLVMIGADLIVAVALYALLRPVNQALALMAALFRVVMDSILGVNLLNLVAALFLLDGTIGGSAFRPDQLQAVAMTLIDIHAVGYSVGLIPFGFGTIVISYLLYRSNYVPRIVAGLLFVAALVYLSGSFIHILAPSYEETFSMAYAVTLVAELTLALWLTFKGIKVGIATSQGRPALAS